MADMTTTDITVDKIQEDFIDFMLSLIPVSGLEQIAEYRLSDAGEAYIRSLLEANRTGKLTSSESQELDHYGELEHWMSRFKLSARLKLKTGSS